MYPLNSSDYINALTHFSDCLSPKTLMQQTDSLFLHKCVKCICFIPNKNFGCFDFNFNHFSSVYPFFLQNKQRSLYAVNVYVKLSQAKCISGVKKYFLFRSDTVNDNPSACVCLTVFNRLETTLNTEN